MIQEKNFKVLKENNVEIDNIDGKIRFVVEGDAVKNLYEIQKAISSFCRDYINSEEWEDLPEVILNAYDDEDNPIVVMPTNIPMSWIERDVEELVAREHANHKNHRRKHVFQYDIWAKVRFLINDLQWPIKYNPGSTLSFHDENANDVVISGVRKWKNIVLLKTSWNEDDAIPIEELLRLLQQYDDDAGVLLQMYWELRGLREGTYYPEDELECEGLIGYDHEYGNDICVASHEIRLFSPSDLEYFMKKLKEECADWKIACYDDDGRLHLVRKINDDDGMNYIIANNKKCDESVTVADFLDYCWDEHGGVVVAYGNDGLLKAIECTEEGIFFKDKLNGKDVIAFRLGDTLYDPVEDEDIDEDDFFTEDDIIVLPSDEG